MFTYSSLFVWPVHPQSLLRLPLLLPCRAHPGAPLHEVPTAVCTSVDLCCCLPRRSCVDPILKLPLLLRCTFLTPILYQGVLFAPSLSYTGGFRNIPWGPTQLPGPQGGNLERSLRPFGGLPQLFGCTSPVLRRQSIRFAS